MWGDLPMGEVSRSDRGADRQTRAPATPHAVRFYGFKGAKGVWGKTRVFPHSLLQIFCRFDSFDRLYRLMAPRKSVPLLYFFS